MKKKRHVSAVALSILVLLAVSQKSQADTATFEGTPVKRAVLNGKWHQGALNNDKSDQAKGSIYFSENSPKQFAIAVLASSVTPETKEVIEKSEGKLSAKQKADLENRSNPFTLRYCAERGEPEGGQISGRHMLLNNFLQEERIRIATTNGAGCKQAFKYECHAFALIKEKLVHIFLVQPLMADKEDTSLLPSMTKEFRSILSTLEWR
ncbi:MAG: hypothetical protein HYX67_13065 [Candidatus Melainabacteria bacterium]|nr:hypothetical protein [Candidatus Melainabacteria bacterium]